MEERRPASQDGTYEDEIQIVDVQPDEITNNNESQSNNGDSVAVLSDQETKSSDEIKDLRICKLFVKWPKLCFGKWRVSFCKIRLALDCTVQLLSALVVRGKNTLH